MCEILFWFGATQCIITNYINNIYIRAVNVNKIEISAVGFYSVKEKGDKYMASSTPF